VIDIELDLLITLIKIVVAEQWVTGAVHPHRALALDECSCAPLAVAHGAVLLLLDHTETALAVDAILYEAVGDYVTLRGGTQQLRTAHRALHAVRTEVQKRAGGSSLTHVEATAPVEVAAAL